MIFFHLTKDFFCPCRIRWLGQERVLGQARKVCEGLVFVWMEEKRMEEIHQWDGNSQCANIKRQLLWILSPNTNSQLLFVTV